MTQPFEFNGKVVTDWRGTPIHPNDLCIYGAPVARSIAMVEGRIVSLTKTGRINVRPIRRAYGGWGDPKVVHVGADRLTIVHDLPPTTMPTEVEKNREKKRESLRRWEFKLQEIHSGVLSPAPSGYGSIAYIQQQIDELHRELVE